MSSTDKHSRKHLHDKDQRVPRASNQTLLPANFNKDETQHTKLHMNPVLHLTLRVPGCIWT